MKKQRAYDNVFALLITELQLSLEHLVLELTKARFTV